MIRAICSFLALALAVTTCAQPTKDSAFESPCPNIFMYEPNGTEPGRWYGVINLTTDSVLYSLWLNIVLESKADILGNWVGEVSTDDNFNFKIENTKLTINPGPPFSIRFFIQYNASNKPPRLQAIRFNGREICKVNTPQTGVGNDKPSRSGTIGKVPERTETTTTTLKPTVTTSTQQTTKAQYVPQKKIESSYQAQLQEKQQTTLKPQHWTHSKVENNYQVKPDDRQQTTLKPEYWTQTKTDDTSQTTLKPKYSQTHASSKPQAWPGVKVDNSQHVKSDNKQQTQTTTVNKVQPTAPIWSPVKVEDSEQIKSQTILENNTKTKPGNSQIGTETQFQVENKQPSRYEESLQKQDKHKSHTQHVQPSAWQQEKVTENQNTKPVSQTQYWPQKATAYNQQMMFSHTHTGVDIQQPIRSEVKYDSDDLSQRHGSYIKVESSLQTRPDDRYQSNAYVRLQSSSINLGQNQDQLCDSRPIYVRPEDVGRVSIQSGISDSRRNLETSQFGSQKETPVNSYQKRTEGTSQIRNEGRLEAMPFKRQEALPKDSHAWSGQNPSQSWSERGQSENDREAFGLSSTSYADDRSGNIDDSAMPYNGYQLTTASPPVITKITDRFDNDNKKEEESNDYFGGLPTIYIPNHAPRRTEPQCGKVFLKPHEEFYYRQTPSLEGQWPWQIALYQQQTSVDFKYICGGTLVSQRHIITAAHCVTRRGSRRLVNRNTLIVYLGKSNLRTSVNGVQIKFVNRIVIHPEYNATTYSRDLAILELRDPVTYSNWVQPACLWPEDETELNDIVGMKGSVVGWGFEVNRSSQEELTLLEMPVVDHYTCIKSYSSFYSRFTSEYTYCAGYKDGTAVCNGDSGGGMVFKKGTSWYLRGVASLFVARQGEYRCDPQHYVIFTDVAKLLPWVEENIDDY